MTTEARDPLRLLGAAEAARILGIDDDDVLALMDRGELAEFRLPAGRVRRRYTSRLAIEAYQRRVIDDTYRHGQAAPVPVGRRRAASA